MGLHRTRRYSTRGLVALALLGTGCVAGLPGVSGGFDTEQLEMLSKVKDAGAVCVSASGVGIPIGGVAVFVSIDKGIRGTVAVEDNCRKIMIDTKKAPPPAPTP